MTLLKNYWITNASYLTLKMHVQCCPTIFHLLYCLLFENPENIFFTTVTWHGITFFLPLTCWINRLQVYFMISLHLTIRTGYVFAILSTFIDTIEGGWSNWMFIFKRKLVRRWWTFLRNDWQRYISCFISISTKSIMTYGCSSRMVKWWARSMLNNCKKCYNRRLSIE